MTGQSFMNSSQTHDQTALQLCRDLIAIPSENPPGDETSVAEFVADVLHQAGFEVTWHEARPGRPNIDARVFRGAGRRLILQAHSDTKPAVASDAQDRWTYDPFSAALESDLLYGLGACDTKGGMAAQLAAACALAREPGWTGELVVQAVADEEDGSRLGAEHLLSLGLLEADGAIVAEPTNCRASLAQLGLAWAEVWISGRAAHAGTPDLANDAFRAALRYIAKVDQLLSPAEVDPAFPGHPRLNVGAFHLPGHPGTVPGECRFWCDVRVLPRQVLGEVLGIFEQAADFIRSPAFSVTVEPYQGGGRPSHCISQDDPLVAALVKAHKQIGEPFLTTPFPGGTDALYLAAAGTPAIVFGPGSLEQAHAPDEYVPVHELAAASEMLTAAALTFLRCGR